MTTMTPMEPKPNVFGRNLGKTLFLIVLACLAVIVFAAEKYLDSKNPRVPAVVQRHVRLREMTPNAIMHITPHERLHQEGSVELRIDEQGFVHPSRVHDDPDWTVVFLGGSTTLCAQLEAKNRFPYIVGRLLETDGSRVNSYNSGVAGSHSMHSNDLLLNKIVPMNPDAVVMMHNINDVATLLFEGSYWNTNWSRSLIVEIRSQPPSFRGLLRAAKAYFVPNLYSRLHQVLARGAKRDGEAGDEWAHVRGKRVVIENEKYVASFRNSLETFVGLCEAHGITPVLMTQPNRLTEKPDVYIAEFYGKVEQDFGVGYDAYRAIYDAFSETIRDVGDSLGVTVIDLAARVPQDGDHMYDGIHLNDRGAQLVAEIVAARLRTILVDESSTR